MSHAPRTVDVAIVGGGLVGAAAAYHLAPRGASVLLIDRGPIGGRASGRPPGLLLTGLEDHPARLVPAIGRERAREAWAFTIENRRLVADVVRAHAIPCELVACGSYVLATFPSERDDLATSFPILREDFPDEPIALLDGDALAREPGAPRGLSAIRFDADAAVDGGALARGLVEVAARAPGVEVWPETEVRALEAGADGARLDTARGEVRAAIAVLATNAEAPRLHRFFERKIWPVRGQGFVTAPLPRFLERAVTASWAHEHYRQLPDGRFVAAGVRADPEREEMTTDEGTSDTFQGYLAKFAAHRFPALPAGYMVERRFSAIAAFVQDGFPIVGPIPGVPSLVAACGFAMRGLSLGMATGRAVARLVADGEKSYPALFSAGRFL